MQPSDPADGARSRFLAAQAGQFLVALRWASGERPVDDQDRYIRGQQDAMQDYPSAQEDRLLKRYATCVSEFEPLVDALARRRMLVGIPD